MDTRKKTPPRKGQSENSPPSRTNKLQFMQPPTLIFHSHTQHSVFVIFFCCMVSAFLAELCTYPLDLVKTNIQIQGDGSPLGVKMSKLATVTVMKKIVETAGILGLYTGMLPMMVKHASLTFGRMVSYEFLLSRFKTKDKDGRTIHYFEGPGMIAAPGGTGAILTNPIDVIKIKRQAALGRKLFGLKKKKITTIRKELKSSRMYSNFTKGIIPNIQRSVAGSAGLVGGYQVTKRYVDHKLGTKNSDISYIVAFFVGSILGPFLSTPFDVVRSRMMNQPVDFTGKGLLYNNAYDCLRKTFLEEGFKGLYRGFTPFSMRTFVWNVVFWFSFEHLRNVFDQRMKN